MELIKCAQCGGEHDIESMDIGFARADAVLAIPAEDREKRCWGNEFDFIQLDQDRWFIRGWLPVPIVGRDRMFGWGVWVEVARDDFHEYVRMFKDDGLSHPPFPGRIANEIPMVGAALGIEVSIQLNIASQRPVLTVSDHDHPLGRDQQNGITAERVVSYIHRHAR